MECVLRSRCGSAQTSSCVKSAPMPARPSAAATLTFAGKAAAPSRALPLKTHVAPFNPSRVMLFSTMWGAPCKALGGLRVTILTELIVPSAAARTASSPSSAPVARMTRAFFLAACFSISGFARMPAPLTVTRIFPREIVAFAISAKTTFGAQSTTISQDSATSSIDMISMGVFRVARKASAFSRRPEAMLLSCNPLIPSSSALATTLPMVPRPTIPTFNIRYLSSHNFSKSGHQTSRRQICAT